jgi:hypothetical protein
VTAPADEVAEHAVPVTARMLLFGAESLTAPANAGWAAAVKGQRRLPRSMRPVAERELLAGLEAVLDIDLGGLLVAGWRQHSALRRAARATLDAPGSTELVALVTHRIASTHRPQVDLLVNDVLVAAVEFELEVVADIDCLLATVRAGRLVQLHTGRCRVQATLACAGEPITSGGATLDAPLIVTVGHGIALIRPEGGRSARPTTLDSPQSTRAQPRSAAG